MKKILSMVLIILLLSNTFCMASSWSQTWTFKPGNFFESGLKGSFGSTIAEYIGNANSPLSKVMGYLSIILIIARIVCLAVMLIMGMIYMFAGSEKRASLKTRSISLFVGLVIIFGSSYIMSLVIRTIDSYI